MIPTGNICRAAHAETLILIHGLSEERHVWARQADDLMRDFDVLAYDVRGFGASPTGDGNGTVEQLADDLAQIVSALGCAPVWLVGFSMGGVIAQRFALDFPDRVKGLVLIASSCTVGKAGVAFFEDRIRQVTAGGIEALRELSQTDSRGCLAPGHDELAEEYRVLRTAAVRDPAGYLNACHAMLRLNAHPMAQELGRIDRSTLVIAGELDPYCPPRASEAIAAAIPDAELEVFENTGHCLHWEQPERTNRSIRNFVLAHG
ncbi:MAG: alpha/beta fold hydrolase [Xanthomonadales bacterium]|nr:alpha/beta fold hydrolase [Xanthomonadales bacterium]NIN59778.1 alpha/beta fold hydrolase [Xanthomonadales bacterium]NIN75153.1 alpha/beta fold hydrolase [Xanthomonadales bacterium]NIO12739.1 alpha/beta fold hydrolase [Xanthomonadales bacterium]NIP12171.1 alpha/beta fold hydrolase [Xanthomonadales bacterium]